MDGDRGGDLILRELLQVAEVDFIARAPRGREVEELTQKQLTKSLRNKIPAEQFVEMARRHSGCEVLHQDFIALALPPGHFDGVLTVVEKRLARFRRT